jgi:hypothetical protein
MNKILLLVYLCAVGIAVAASTSKITTRSIAISGRVKEEKKISVTDLHKFTAYEIGDIAITNHTGELKGTARELKGVRFRDVLETIKLETENPKLNSEYYFICKATDGYKVVYSWNEIFNTATGESVYLVTEKEGKTMDDHEDAILMISTKDLRTGRRYVKNLDTIIVGRAD